MNCLSCLFACLSVRFVCLCLCLYAHYFLFLFIEYLLLGYLNWTSNFLFDSEKLLFSMCNENSIGGSENLKRFSFIYSVESIIHHDIICHLLKSVFHLNLSFKYFSLLVVYLICIMRSAWKNVCYRICFHSAVSAKVLPISFSSCSH